MKPTLPQELSWGSRRGILKSGDSREPFYIVIQAVCCWDKQMREFKRRENFFCFMESELMVHGFWLHCCWARRRQNIIAERCGATLFTSWCLEKGERRDRRGRERKRRGEEDRQTDLGRTAPKEQGSLLRSLSPSSWSHLWKPPSPLSNRWIHQWITPLIRPEPSWSNNFREWIWDLGTNREDEVMSFAGEWTQLETVMLGKSKQLQKDKYYVFFHSKTLYTYMKLFMYMWHENRNSPPPWETKGTNEWRERWERGDQRARACAYHML